MHTFTRSVGVLLLAAVPTLAMARENAHAATAASAHAQAAAPAATTPEATVDAFAQALRRGDTATLRTLLASDVLILEGGGAERSAEEYLSGHAVSDAAFLKAAHIQQTARLARSAGDLAWVATESELHVQRDGQPVTLKSAETMLLQKIDGAWRIVHIHWSTARRTKAVTP